MKNPVPPTMSEEQSLDEAKRSRNTPER